jgi:hypothetical protein
MGCSPNVTQKQRYVGMGRSRSAQNSQRFEFSITNICLIQVRMPRSDSKSVYRSRAQEWRAISERAPSKEAKATCLGLAAAYDSLTDLAADGEEEIEPPADAE